MYVAISVVYHCHIPFWVSVSAVPYTPGLGNTAWVSTSIRRRNHLGFSNDHYDSVRTTFRGDQNFWVGPKFLENWSAQTKIFTENFGPGTIFFRTDYSTTSLWVCMEVHAGNPGIGNDPCISTLVTALFSYCRHSFTYEEAEFLSEQAMRVCCQV